MPHVTQEEVQRTVAALDMAEANIKSLLAFVDFVNTWVHRGPPHGGEGNEKTVIDVIKNHPVAVDRRNSKS